jgi:hypothetical protein
MYLQNSNNNDDDGFYHFWGLEIETLQNHFILNLLHFSFSFWQNFGMKNKLYRTPHLLE